MKCKLFVDSLSIKSLFILADKVLPHISLQDGLKHRVDELLFLSKQSLGIRGSRALLGIKNFFTSMCPGHGNGGLPPGVPLFFIFEHRVMGLITFDPLLELFSRRESGGPTLGVGDRGSEQEVRVPIGADTEGVKVLLGDGVKIRTPAIFALVPPKVALQNQETFLLGLVKGCSVEICLKCSKF